MENNSKSEVEEIAEAFARASAMDAIREVFPETGVGAFPADRPEPYAPPTVYRPNAGGPSRARRVGAEETPQKKEDPNALRQPLFDPVKHEESLEGALTFEEWVRLCVSRGTEEMPLPLIKFLGGQRRAYYEDLMARLIRERDSKRKGT